MKFLAAIVFLTTVSSVSFAQSYEKKMTPQMQCQREIHAGKDVQWNKGAKKCEPKPAALTKQPQNNAEKSLVHEEKSAEMSAELDQKLSEDPNLKGCKREDSKTISCPNDGLYWRQTSTIEEGPDTRSVEEQGNPYPVAIENQNVKGCKRVDATLISCTEGMYKHSKAMTNAPRQSGKGTERKVPADTRSIENQGNPQ